jgi:hypothetical protein
LTALSRFEDTDELAGGKAGRSAPDARGRRVQADFPRKFHALWSFPFTLNLHLAGRKRAITRVAAQHLAAAKRANTRASMRAANLLQNRGLDVSSLDCVSTLKGIPAGLWPNSTLFGQPASHPARKMIKKPLAPINRNAYCSIHPDAGCHARPKRLSLAEHLSD